MVGPRKPKTPTGARQRKSASAAAPAPRAESAAREAAPAAVATAAVVAGGANGVAFEAIQRRAYELFLARGAGHGGDLADWLAAERELKGRPAARD